MLSSQTLPMLKGGYKSSKTGNSKMKITFV
jgi:hypothetical protein